MFIYSLGFAVFFALLAMVYNLAVSERKQPISVLVINLIVLLLVNLVVNYAFQPYYTHLLAGGYFWVTMIDMVVVSLVTWGISAGADVEANDAIGLGITLLMAIAMWALVDLFYTPGAFCDTAGYKQMASVIKVEDMGNQVYPDTDPDHLIQVAPQTAYLKAARKLGGDSNLGSYLKVGKPYLQPVGQGYYYIVALGISDWWAFKARGGVIPGYIVVDALDPQKEAELKLGYNIRYDPEAAFWSDQNLNRHVYFDYLLGTSWRVDDLDGGLEVDDNWKPYYTGTLLKHVIGFQGMAPDGVITVDPQSGEIVRYGLDKVPAWVDRVYSLGYIQRYVRWWGDWAFRDPGQCWLTGTANQRKIDSDGYVVTYHGLVAEVTMTSYNADQALTEIVYVNLRNGHAQRYHITGAIEKSVEHLVEEKTKSTVAGGSAEGFDAVQCQVQNLLSRQVWYCLLIGRSGGKSESAGSFAGYAFVQTANTADNTRVIISNSSLQEAYTLLRSQVASAGEVNPALSEALKMAQFNGRVARISGIYGTTTQYLIFTLAAPQSAQGGPDLSSLVFRVDAAKIPLATLVREGDEVIVTAMQARYDNFTDVVSVQDKALPGFGR